MIKQLILFDIDGTLLVSKGIGRAAKHLAMTEYFGESGEIENHEFGGKTDWQIVAELLEPFGKSRDEIGAVMTEYEDVMTRKMLELRDQFVAEPCPFAMELVQALLERDDIMIGLVTGNMSKTAPIKLEMAGYDPAWFAVGAYGNESANRNDLPRLAIDRAQKLTNQVFDGQHVIVIGDTQDDILCARSVGATAVAVCTGFTDRDKLICADPDFLLADLSTFLDLVVV